MRNKIGWHGAFLAAGVGMFIGVITFIIGMKNYRHVDVRRVPKEEDRPFIIRFVKVLLVGTLFAILGYMIPGTVSSSNSTDAFFMFCIPVVYFFSSIYFNATAEEKKPLGTMFTIFIIVILFWAIFKQNGTALTIYAKSYTDRQMPDRMVKSAEDLGFTEKVVATKAETFQLDQQFRKMKDASGEPLKTIDYPPYFKNIDPQKMPAEGEPVYLINTEILQSVNPFFVVALTPLLIAFFAFLRRRKREPTTATKIAAGLFISALSTLVMVAAVHYTGNGVNKASIGWLVACYGVITIGELCLSPMGLSMVSKLSPVRLTALMMGGWSLATSIGNKLSGELGKTWDKFDNKAGFFWVNCLLLLIAFCIMLLMLRRLNRVFRESAH
jgi:proton-dependent oligopeptide transporter, POT family